jgi:alpha-amylase
MKNKIQKFCWILMLIFVTQKNFAQSNPNNRQILLQGFWWDFKNNNYTNGWANYLAELAPRLKEMGIDAIWIPPSIKNQSQNSVGYAPFDHYDLGDKYQKGFLKTKLGDKDELLRMIAVMKANGIEVIQDIILNHLTGAGSSSSAGGSDPQAMDDGSTNKYKNFRYVSFSTPAINETSNNYLARIGRFPKNWQNFYPNNNNVCCTNDINSPFWGPDISYESNAFGLSSNAIFNPAQSSDYMRNGMRNWMIWYKKQTGFDGVRLDAIKHFSPAVAEDYLWNLQFGSLWANGGNDMFAVGEWVGGGTDLDNWCNAVQNRAGTFDFALRNALTGIISGNGNFDLAAVPGYQQQNRGRTVPFVNNHDTYRPILDNNGNITGWNTSQQLGAQIPFTDGRFSVTYAIALAVDGAPEIFFEDIFKIGSGSNRFTHFPNDTVGLPYISDVKNLIWCHQNLHFKQGPYLVRWQAQDALVIERGGKALIGVNDQWTNWQNLTGVQTSFADGTVLVDYSGANGNASRTVYGGGKVDIDIPPCNGSALNGRRGYCVWAPQGITTNYVNAPIRTTQEWEMDNDLGDGLVASLQQGGKLPDNNTECRVVGRIFPKQGDTVFVDLYPASPNLPITMTILDKDCTPIDSVTVAGTINYSFVPQQSNWYTIRIKNATATQLGQKCWVKVNYLAPQVVQTNVVKNKCQCFSGVFTDVEETIAKQNFLLAPNPAENILKIAFDTNNPEPLAWDIVDMNGRKVKSSLGKTLRSEENIDISMLEPGMYFIRFSGENVNATKSFIKIPAQ